MRRINSEKTRISNQFKQQQKKTSSYVQWPPRQLASVSLIFINHLISFFPHRFELFTLYLLIWEQTKNDIYPSKHDGNWRFLS